MTAVMRQHDAVHRLRLGGKSYPCLPGESVLQTMLRNGVNAPHSCCAGTCLVCMVKCRSGIPSPAAQESISEALRLQGYILACSFVPTTDVEIDPDDGPIFTPAEILSKTPLGGTVDRIRLRPLGPFAYRPGQFLMIKGPAGVTRSYCLASLPEHDPDLEIHVSRMQNGALSTWIFDTARPGDQVDIAGPYGGGVYESGRPNQPMLMIGDGTGLAPLIGIVRDALRNGHRGEIRLYHGSPDLAGLYMDNVLRVIAARQPNFRYFGCLGSNPGIERLRHGRPDALAFGDIGSLVGWRVFLAGNPQMVRAARRTARFAGAASGDIYGDPFDLRDLRRRSRG